MVSGSQVGGILRAHREARGLRQADVADRAQVSPHSLQSYEAGRRRPSRETVRALGAALELRPAELGELLAALGDEADASPLVRALREVRGQPARWVQELAECDWVVLVMNERHQILGWNHLANAVSEMDLGVGLPSQFERNLLWMASLPWYVERLANWDELIGKLIGTLKREGVDLEGGGVPPYFNALLQRMAVERPQMLDRFFRLWIETPPIEEGRRNAYPAKWRLPDGTELSFVAAHRDLSLYDGTFAFDWHAANARTTAWLEQAFDRVGSGAELPGVQSLTAEDVARALREAREEMGLSRRELAERAGLSEDAIFKHETGRRVPARETLIGVCRALSVDGLETNRMLEALGYDYEPSDFALWITGNARKGIFHDRPDVTGRNLQQIRTELRSLEWPCFLLNSRCEVEDANESASRITGYRRLPVQQGRTGPHLVQAMVSPLFRQRLLNWDQVAARVVPAALRPTLLGLEKRKPDDELQRLSRWLGREEPEALRALMNAWETQPEKPAPRRVWSPIEWLDDSGELLRFHCLITPWNAYDGYWSIDWHPANGAAWRAMAGS